MPLQSLPRSRHGHHRHRQSTRIRRPGPVWWPAGLQRLLRIRPRRLQARVPDQATRCQGQTPACRNRQMRVASTGPARQSKVRGWYSRRPRRARLHPPQPVPTGLGWSAMEPGWWTRSSPRPAGGTLRHRRQSAPRYRRPATIRAKLLPPGRPAAKFLPGALGAIQ